MSKSRISVGIDVGKDELVVVAAASKAKTFGTTAPELRRLIEWVRHQAGSQPVHTGLEATGVYSQKVAVALHEAGLAVSVINAAQISAHRKALLTRTKTDRVDAWVIWDFVVKHEPPLWSPPSPAQQQVHALVSQLDALKAELGQWKNRQHAQTHAVGTPEAVSRSTAAMLTLLAGQIEQLEEAIATLVAENPALAEAVAVLTSIKGVGVTSAVRVVAYGGEALTSRTRRQLDAHAGLAPAQKQSGSSVHGRSHLAKQGNAALRQALYMPVLVAVRYNPIFKTHYEQLLSRNKAKKVALVACMRKLLNIMRALLLKKTPFDPNYQCACA
mgnify:CR=1 FL=1